MQHSCDASVTNSGIKLYDYINLNTLAIKIV